MGKEWFWMIRNCAKRQVIFAQLLRTGEGYDKQIFYGGTFKKQRE